MNTSTRLQENISAMVDDALPPCEVELTLAALAEPEGRATWQAYQLIGDTLRADAAGAELSPAFAARLRAALAAEPTPAREEAAGRDDERRTDPAPARSSPRDDNASPAAAVVP